MSGRLFFRRIVFLLICLLLTSCGRSSRSQTSASRPAAAVSFGTVTLPPSSTGATASTQASSSSSSAADTTGEEALQIGIVLPSMQEPRWMQDMAQFDALLEEASLRGKVLFSDADAEKERANIADLVEEGAQVIVLCAHDREAVVGAIEDAKKKGVTIICYDRLVRDTEAVDYFVTFDSVAVGRAQAQYLIDHAPHGRGIPLYLYAGAATDNNAFLFFESAWSVLQPKIADGTFALQNVPQADIIKDERRLTNEQIASVLGIVSTEWDFDKARELAEQDLSLPGVQKGDVCILAPNDGTARQIADVFAADPLVTQYIITGQDAEIASVQYIIDGKQSMTVFKDTRLLAADCFSLANAVLQGETPATDTTYDNGAVQVPSRQVHIVPVDRGNVESALIDSGYYDAGVFTGLDGEGGDEEKEENGTTKDSGEEP